MDTTVRKVHKIEFKHDLNEGVVIHTIWDTPTHGTVYKKPMPQHDPLATKAWEDSFYCSKCSAHWRSCLCPEGPFVFIVPNRK